jgi:hypothetical protein
MRLTRRVEYKVDYWYCNESGCPEGLTGHHNLSEAEAEAHANESGHEARLVKTREVVIRPFVAEGVAP